MSRLWRRTDGGKWKIEQCSVGPETAKEKIWTTKVLYEVLAGGEKDKGLSLLKSDLAHICRRLNLKGTLKPTSKWRLLELVSNLNYRTKLSNISASGTTKELRYITNMKVTCLVICQAWENCLLVISQNINSDNCSHIVVCTSEYMYIKSIKSQKEKVL